MASTKLAFQAIAVLLLQVSWCAVAQPASNAAVMSLAIFAGGDDPAACDGKFHSNVEELIVALSTVWFNGGSMCNMKIRITLPNGLNLVAEVVDECDTQRGCNDNMIATSYAVWDALGLDTNVGDVPVTWSIA